VATITERKEKAWKRGKAGKETNGKERESKRKRKKKKNECTKNNWTLQI